MGSVIWWSPNYLLFCFGNPKHASGDLNERRRCCHGRKVFQPLVWKPLPFTPTTWWGSSQEWGPRAAYILRTAVKAEHNNINADLQSRILCTEHQDLAANKQPANPKALAGGRSRGERSWASSGICQSSKSLFLSPALQEHWHPPRFGWAWRPWELCKSSPDKRKPIAGTGMGWEGKGKGEAIGESRPPSLHQPLCLPLLSCFCFLLLLLLLFAMASGRLCHVQRSINRWYSRILLHSSIYIQDPPPPQWYMHTWSSH